MKKLTVTLIFLFCLSVSSYGDRCNLWETWTHENIQYIQYVVCSESIYPNPTCAYKWQKIDSNWSKSSPFPHYSAGYNIYPWDGDLSDCENTDCYSGETIKEIKAMIGYIGDGNSVTDLFDEKDEDFGGITEDNLSDVVDLIDDLPPSDSDTPPAEDPFENPEMNTKEIDPVFMSNGEYAYSTTDLSISGRGLNVEIVRTYGSRREYNSRFGYGWDINYNMKVRRLAPIGGEPNAVILLDGVGYRREYTQDDTDPNLFIRDNDLSNYLDFNDVDDAFSLQLVVNRQRD